MVADVHLPAYAGCFEPDGSYSEQCEGYLRERESWGPDLPWVPDTIPNP